MSSSNCCFLSCIQVSQETGWVVWYSHLSKNFPQFVVIYTVKGFSIVNEAEVDVFLEFPCFFYDPAYVGNLISGSFAFSKSSLYIWKFSVHILLKPSLEDFEHYLASLWNECNCCSLWFFQTIRFRTGSALKSLSNWGFWEISCWGLRNQLLEICPEKVGLGENITRCWTSPGLSQRLIISVLKCPLSRAVAFKL